MKKCFLFQMILALIFMFTINISSASVSGSPKTSRTAIGLPGLPADTTITVTIVKIDLAPNKVTLKDQSGKLYVFVVDPQVIDLSKFKVGQTVTATVSTTLITNKVTRAKITKAQLIKLQ
jgi:hypothetical protein